LINGANISEELDEEKKNDNRKRIAEDFSFGKLLGEGSFAEVKEATETATGHIFAIKILNKQQIIKEKKVKYVQTEKTILNMLKHPNIVLLYYTFQDPSRLYFVLELCPNGELLDLIKKVGKFNNELAKFYGAEIVNAVEYIHSKGIIHRDLKPENVLLDPKMHAKLNDFGTAKVIGNDRKARSNSFTGTAEYVPPELLKEKSAGRPGDLWSLGCILYQMLIGKPPFHGDTEWQTFRKVIENKPDFPPEFDIKAMDLVCKLLVTDPNRRLGAGEEGFDEIKTHPFFDGIDWNNIHLQTPPNPTATSSFSNTPFIRNNLDNNNMRYSLPAPKLSPNKANQDSPRKMSSPQPPAIKLPDRILQLEQQKNSLWSKFLANGELIVHSGLVTKTKGLSKKKRQLILTDLPRLFYLDPEKMEQRGEIPWSKEMRVVVKDNKKFQIATPGRVFHIEDTSNESKKWADAIQGLLKTITP